MTKRTVAKIIDYTIISFLIFAVLFFILFPFLAVFKEAFFNSDGFSIDLLTSIFKSNTKTILNTLKMGLSTSILSSIVSFCTACALYLSNRKIKKIWLLILSITLISPPFVTSLSFINLFGRRGLVTYHLLKLKLNPYGMWGIVMMQVISDISLNTLMIYSFLKNIDQDIINSARNLGANTNNIIKDHLLAASIPGIKAVLLLSFFRSIADFGTPAIIGGNFNVLALESYFAVIAEGNLSKAAAINILLIIPSLIIFVIYGKQLNTISTSQGFESESEIPIKKKGWLYYLILSIAGFFTIALIILYSQIFLSSITKMYKGNIYFTLDNIIETKPYITGTAIRSIIYSLISAITGSIMGLMIGYYLKKRKLKAMKYIEFFSNLPYIIPGTFFGLGYLLFFKHPPLVLTGTALIVVLNVTFKQLPFSTRMGVSAMDNISSDTLNSIRDLGGARIDEIKDAIIPLSKDSLSVSFINAFTTTMTTIGSIIFLIYPSQKVLTLVMFDVIQSGKYNIGSVIAVFIIVICLVVNISFNLYLNRRKNVFRSKEFK
ncbi:MAG: iron ABC transporter permease [Firmicutes bacterium]|nr:iron ABC transporter permease [Bacillota bacterium]